MYKELYKQNVNTGERQEQRRRQLLEQQKRQRELKQDENREFAAGLCENVTEKFNHKHKKYSQIYGNDRCLQLSEWMKEKPEDLNQWLLVPCPKGQRCLVVAGKGKTSMFSKSGRKMFEFISLLPGGGAEKTRHRAATILDCVYVAAKDEFYVLDAISYGQQDLKDCESQFRLFWLKSKFDEELFSERNEVNEKPLHLLHSYDFDNSHHIAKALQHYPLWPDNQPELDGFLFYHKEASYTSGTTPLVCWLFPFMITDILGLQVASEYTIPDDYQGPLEYMHNFDKQLKMKRNKYHKTDEANSMDITFENESLNEDSMTNDIMEEQRCLELGEELLHE